jgi:hypothetical protein
MTDTDVFTSADVALMVDNLATRLGSRRKVAEAMMVTPSYITNVIDGSTNPGPAITDYFGLRKESKGIFVSALGDGEASADEERDILAELHRPRKPSEIYQSGRPARDKDPMKLLGLDYVTAKLAGRIKKPRGRGKQIRLDGDTLSIYD